jgi:membrane-associated protein
MNVARFWAFNMIGAIAWVVAFTVGGYFFGTVPLVRDNLTLSMVVVVAVSMAPAAVGAVRGRRRRRASRGGGQDAAAEGEDGA